MDKYEYKLRAEEIRNLAANKQYAEAMKIADTIDWTRVKSVMMLNVVSEIYKVNRRLEDSKEILLLAYDRNPGSRSVLYSLCEISIKLEEFVQAIEYYKEFVQAAPKDTGRYILQYKLYEAQEVSLEERIGVLEEFKKRDYREKWAYELAFLYHRIGLSTRCVEECDELILWFGEGKYVTKAMELKMLHEPLTPAQLEKYEKRNGKKAMVYEEDIPEEEEEMDIQVKTLDMGQYNTINLQQELAASMQELMAQSEETNSVAESIVAPLLENTIPMEPIQKDIEEVFFEDYTGELPNEEIPNEEIPDEEFQDEELPEEELPEDEIPSDYVVEQKYYVEEEELFTEEEKAAVEEALEEDVAVGEEPQIKVESMDAPLRPTLEKMLSQEYDGQISLVVPETEKIEKQITGQMSIEDILLEWERMKKENEEKRREDVRQRVLEQTSDMFSEFDASTKASILEDLNRLAEDVDNGEVEEETEELSESEQLAEAITEEMEIEELEEIAEEEGYEEIAEDIVEDGGYDEEFPEETVEYDEEFPEETVEYDEEFPEETGEYDEYYGELPEGEEYYEDGEYYEELPEGETYYEEVAETEDIPEEAVVSEAPAEEEYFETASGRDLSEEQEKIFASFIGSHQNRRQIIDAIDKVSLAAYTGNIIITGDMGTGTLKLAKSLIKEVQLTDNNFSGKVAKVSGEMLNKRNLSQTLSMLKNGALAGRKSRGFVKQVPAGIVQSFRAGK